MAHSLQNYWNNGLLLKAIRDSVQHLLIGFGISIVLGMIIGMACGANKYIDDTLGSLVLGMQSLPSVTWLPLALIWFGLNGSRIGAMAWTLKDGKVTGYRAYDNTRC